MFGLENNYFSVAVRAALRRAAWTFRKDHLEDAIRLMLSDHFDKEEDPP